MEQSVFIIKPEGIRHREAIRQMIEIPGLYIMGSYFIAMPKWVLAKLYPDLAAEKGKLWDMTCRHLFNKQCEVGIVRGRGAMEKLLAVCGTDKSPAQCGPRTIRGLFGYERPVELVGGQRYWLNVIHRPKNKEEAVRDAKIYFALRSSGS